MSCQRKAQWRTGIQLQIYGNMQSHHDLRTRSLAHLPNNGLNDTENDDVNMEGVEEQEKPLRDNPILMTETGWNAGKDRERGIEIAMENWGSPAFWLARNGVLTS